jgi:heat shock protein HtpX
MKIAKRVFLFLMVNLLIITTITMLTSVLGLQPYLSSQGLNYQSLMVFCVIWGFGGAFISLALSRVMAKWMMGVQIIKEPKSADEAWLFNKVHDLAKKANLKTMPEVGIYQSDDLNAFATGPTKNRSLVAVSTGLLRQMNKTEVEGVLAHEVAHITNGDMVTMTLLQGVVNAFVMFFARIIGFAVSQMVDEEKRPWVNFGVIIVAEIVLGILGMLVTSKFSRMREFRADKGGAELSSRGSMIAALEALRARYGQDRSQSQVEEQPALASLKISGKSGGLLQLFSTHPDLSDRIARLKSS